ncbi:hypothetical protein HWV62_20501 [Athelia sp. TMB]|nr:hypothetical protein HWV62_20501 [Athelia sp. TMB]
MPELKRAVGRPTWVYGTKLRLFQVHSKEWSEAKDKGSAAVGTFYTNLTKIFIACYGWHFDYKESDLDHDCVEPTKDIWSAVTDTNGLDQSEVDKRLKYYQDLRQSIVRWWSTYHNKPSKEESKQNQMEIQTTLAKISKQLPKPPRRTRMTQYYSKWYFFQQEHLKSTFDTLWEHERTRVLAPGEKRMKRLDYANKVTEEYYAKESEHFKTWLHGEREKQFQVKLKKYQEKMKALDAVPSDPSSYHKALSNAASFMQPLCDLTAKKFGAAVSMIVVLPVENGTIQMRSVFSGKTQGLHPQIFPEFDPDAFDALQESYVNFGHHVFSQADRDKRTIWKQSEEGADGKPGDKEDDEDEEQEDDEEEGGEEQLRERPSSPPADLESLLEHLQSTSSTYLPPTPSSSQQSPIITAALQPVPAPLQQPTPPPAPPSTLQQSTPQLLPSLPIPPRSPSPRLPHYPQRSPSPLPEPVPPPERELLSASQTATQPTHTSTPSISTAPTTPALQDIPESTADKISAVLAVADKWGAEWAQLVATFIQFERNAGFTTKEYRLPASSLRPAAFKAWFAMKRPTSGPSWEELGTGDSLAYGKAWWAWWADMQPPSRQIEGDMAPDTDGSALDWTRLCKPGAYGIMLVLVSLMWWKNMLGELVDSSWTRAVLDVEAVLRWSLKPAPATSAPKPAPKRKRAPTDADALANVDAPRQKRSVKPTARVLGITRVEETTLHQDFTPRKDVRHVTKWTCRFGMMA